MIAESIVDCSGSRARGAFLPACTRRNVLLDGGLLEIPGWSTGRKVRLGGLEEYLCGGAANDGRADIQKSGCLLQGEEPLALAGGGVMDRYAVIVALTGDPARRPAVVSSRLEAQPVQDPGDLSVRDRGCEFPYDLHHLAVRRVAVLPPARLLDRELSVLPAGPANDHPDAGRFLVHVDQDLSDSPFSTLIIFCLRV